MTVQSGKTSWKAFCIKYVQMGDRIEITATCILCSLESESLPLLSGQEYMCSTSSWAVAKKRPFISQICLYPLGPNSEAITSDSTMSYGQFSSRRSMWGRNAASSECKVGETGISHNRQSWQERERRGKRNHRRKSRHGERMGPEHWAEGVDVFACVGLCTCVCANTPRANWGSSD